MTGTNEPVTAAAVSYRPLPEPPAAYRDYYAADGVTARFLEITSLDGRTGTAVLLAPGTADPAAPLVISVHGSGGSITSQPVRLLSRGLSAAGVPVLAIDTRQSGGAVNTDSFYATVRDIEAAFWVARSLGHDRIVLHGHSLGTSQVTYFAGTHWHGEIVGVLLTGMFADLPWKSRHLLINDEAAYARLGGEAAELAGRGDYAAVLKQPMRWLHGAEMPVTAQHFLSYRQTGTAGARSVDWIARVPFPLLMVRDAHDPVISYFEPGQLQAAADAGISPSVTSVLLPSPEGTNGHAFEASGDALVELASGWVLSLLESYR
ncbi:MAG: alpha/beta hydrolase [Streptosporangiaceae bacterium]